MGRTVSNASGYAPDDDEFDPRADDFVSKERNYIHFDLPLSETERTGLAFSSQQIVSHSFWPLLGFVSVERRAKRDKSGALSFVEKERAIKFGSHGDAALLECYTRKVTDKYEKFMRKQDFKTCILAYRKGVGDNIDQSKSLFDEIASRQNCTAIAVDISGFFDNIDHENLKNCLYEVLGVNLLEKSDYKIFKRMTNFEWVDSEKLRERLGRYFGLKGRICTASQFRKLVRGTTPNLVEINTKKFGIPQGTPLSGLYANISMCFFDSAMHELTSRFGGIYRRYSDDIAIVIPEKLSADFVINFIEIELSKIGLELSHKKTEVSVFSNSTGLLKSDKPFQYLGFTFDGSKILIRQSSLNRYYSKMHSGIKSKIRAAQVKGIDQNTIFLRQLYQRYTHFGKHRNFPRYAYRAAEKFGSPDIRNQIRRHMVIFKKALRYYIDRAYN